MVLDRRQFLAGLGIAGLEALLTRQLGADLTKTPLVIINPGHNYQSSGYHLGAAARGIGEEYRIVTRIADATAESLRSKGISTLVTRDEKEYAPDIRKYIDANRKPLTLEFLDSLRRKHHHDLTLSEGILQLGIMRYAEKQRAAAVVSIHIDDTELKTQYLEGFTVYIGNHHSEDSHPEKHKDHVEYDEQSMKLGLSVRDALAAEKLGNAALPISNTALNDDRKNFRGLAAKHLFILGNGRITMTAPSILVECGFMRQNYVIGGTTHHINSGPVQQAYADGIANGIVLNFSQPL